MQNRIGNGQHFKRKKHHFYISGIQRKTRTLSLVVMSAPAFSSSRTQSARPSIAARISTVHPSCAHVANIHASARATTPRLTHAGVSIRQTHKMREHMQYSFRWAISQVIWLYMASMHKQHQWLGTRMTEMDRTMRISKDMHASAHPNELQKSEI